MESWLAIVIYRLIVVKQLSWKTLTTVYVARLLIRCLYYTIRCYCLWSCDDDQYGSCTTKSHVSGGSHLCMVSELVCDCNWAVYLTSSSPTPPDAAIYVNMLLATWIDLLDFFACGLRIFFLIALFNAAFTCVVRFYYVPFRFDFDFQSESDVRLLTVRCLASVLYYMRCTFN